MEGLISKGDYNQSGKKRFQVTYNSTEQNDLLHWLVFNQALKRHNSSLHYFGYFGGARSKGFAALGNVSKLLFLGLDWARKVCRLLFLVLFGELRAELARDISRSQRFL